jgi:DNA polymerase-3 subunit beta
MKLVVNKDVILDGLQKVQSIVGTRSTLPILYNILLKAEGSSIALTSTDLEMSVRTSVEAKVTRGGATTLPARRIFSIFRELPPGDIDIDVDDKDVATIKAGSSTFKVVGISEDEFPAIPKIQTKRVYTIEQKRLRRMLSVTAFSASTDETRYVLNGCLLSFKGGKLTVVATDGRRMALDETELEFLKEAEGDVIVATKAVNELLRTLRDEEKETVKVQVSENQVSFEFDNMLIVSKLIDGTYPNFRQVIPQHSEQHVAIDREILLAAVRRVSLMASDKTNSVTLNFAKNKLIVSTIAPEIGEATENVAVKYSGKEVSISFNPDFLLDALRNLTAGEVSMDLTDDLSPGVLHDDTPFIYVLMPMRVR